MLTPKRTKYRKAFRGKMRGKALRGEKLVFGDWGLMSTQAGWIDSRQIESGRKVLTRYVAKGGRLWIRIFPDKPITDKPPEVRMGQGKGDVVGYVAVLKPGRIIYEMSGVTEEMAKKSLKIAGSKMPVLTKIVKK